MTTNMSMNMDMNMKITMNPKVNVNMNVNIRSILVAVPKIAITSTNKHKKLAPAGHEFALKNCVSCCAHGCGRDLDFVAKIVLYVVLIFGVIWTLCSKNALFLCSCLWS